jgi:hypothetical protein
MARDIYPRWLVTGSTWLVIAVGLLHIGSLLYQAEGPIDGFLVGLLALSALPYFVCIVLLRVVNNVGAALGGLVAIVALDAFMYWAVFISPRGSTAAVGSVFAPIWKLFVLLPLGALIGFAVDAAATRRFA